MLPRKRLAYILAGAAAVEPPQVLAWLEDRPVRPRTADRIAAAARRIGLTDEELGRPAEPPTRGGQS